MEAVAAGDEIALELLLPVVVLEADRGTVGLEPLNADAGHLEQQRRSARKPGGDQILHDLGLAVDDDRPALREVAERDPVPLALELQLDAVMHESLAAHALPDARALEQIRGALFQHACADALLDVLAAARLEHDRVDALDLEQPRQHEPGRPRAHDADLRAHQPPRPCRSKSAAWACPTPTHRVARP